MLSYITRYLDVICIDFKTIFERMQNSFHIIMHPNKPKISRYRSPCSCWHIMHFPSLGIQKWDEILFDELLLFSCLHEIFKDNLHYYERMQIEDIFCEDKAASKFSFINKVTSLWKHCLWLKVSKLYIVNWVWIWYSISSGTVEGHMKVPLNSDSLWVDYIPICY